MDSPILVVLGVVAGLSTLRLLYLGFKEVPLITLILLASVGCYYLFFWQKGESLWGYLSQFGLVMVELWFLSSVWNHSRPAVLLHLASVCGLIYLLNR